MHYYLLVVVVLSDKKEPGIMARRRRSYSYDYSYDYYEPDPLADPLLHLVTRHTLPQPIRALEKVTRNIRRDALVSLARLEDNRVWNPEPLATRRARATRRESADLVLTDRTRTPTVALSSGLSFRDPSRVSVCAKRKIRREVIFAKGGGGGARKRTPRRTPFSDVSC